VLRQAHLDGHGRSGEVARALVAGRAPVARFPEGPKPGQLQVAVFDLNTPPPAGVVRRASGTARR
jgi:hypothetical protein